MVDGLVDHGDTANKKEMNFFFKNLSFLLKEVHLEVVHEEVYEGGHETCEEDHNMVADSFVWEDHEDDVVGLVVDCPHCLLKEILQGDVQ